MPELLTARLTALLRDAAGREALVDGQRRITYGALGRAAQAFAAFLLDRGFRPGARVALILPNSVEAVAAVYGTWLAGGIAVPLNVLGTERDFATWLDHCEPEVVVFDAANAQARVSAQQSPTVRCRVVVGATAGTPAAPAPHAAPSECDWRHIEPNAPIADPVRAVGTDEAALILYTSGTTGAPKGVTLSHGNLAANAAAVVASLQLTATDSVLSPLPFYHAYGASVLHSHLSVGGRVVLEHSMAFPHAVVEAIVRERVTGFSGVSSTYALLLSRVNLAKLELRDLRYVTQAGSAMPNALTQRLLAALPRMQLFIMYGQTEATSRLTCLPPEGLHDRPGSVGIPVAGTTLQVRDEEGRTMAAGEQGEVWAHGPGVMLGYWRDPEGTCQAIRDGWLRTGDVGCLDAQGYLYLAGRRSDMIKTGGQRVSPLEIEEVVAEIEGVAEVVAVGVDDALLGQSIRVFIVPTADAHLDALAVKGHCRRRMAAYKVPKSVEIVASLPRTSSGKVRRAELQRRTAGGTT